MGTLEEEQLVQMVQDFIEPESQSPISSTFCSNSLPLNLQSKQFTLKEICNNWTGAEAEVVERVLMHMRSKRPASEKTRSIKKWLVMKLKMDGYNASLCQTSWSTSLGCPAGDYEYLDITLKNYHCDDPIRLIIDTDFKSQFEVARPTPAYKELTDTLPSIFVGKEEKLIKIISLVCSAAKQSLRDRGLHIPPWRTRTYMQSKWLSLSPAPSSSPMGSFGIESEIMEAKAGSSKFIKRAPPIVNTKRRMDLGGGGSGLSSQFSNLGINCC